MEQEGFMEKYGKELFVLGFVTIGFLISFSIYKFDSVTFHDKTVFGMNVGVLGMALFIGLGLIMFLTIQSDKERAKLPTSYGKMHSMEKIKLKIKK